MPSSRPPTEPRRALLPGTFDPPTLGHLDLVQRALGIFAHVTVGLAEHPTKAALFTVEERLELWRASLAELLSDEDRERVDVRAFDGLVAHAAQRFGCAALVRGVRNGTDFDYEMQMATTIRHLAADVETCLLTTRPELAHVTGTLARQIARMSGPIDSFVPAPVVAALRARFPGA